MVKPIHMYKLTLNLFLNRNYHHKMIYNCDSADLFRLENTKYFYLKIKIITAK